MADGLKTKFDPERIAQVAEALLTYQTKMLAAFNEINQRTNLLKQYWQSDAADDYHAKAAVYNKFGAEHAETLLSLATRLQKISGIQRKAEKDTSAEAEALPIDGVN